MKSVGRESRHGGSLEVAEAASSARCRVVLIREDQPEGVVIVSAELSLDLRQSVRERQQMRRMWPSIAGTQRT